MSCDNRSRAPSAASSLTTHWSAAGVRPVALRFVCGPTTSWPRSYDERRRPVAVRPGPPPAARRPPPRVPRRCSRGRRSPPDTSAPPRAPAGSRSAGERSASAIRSIVPRLTSSRSLTRCGDPSGPASSARAASSRPTRRRRPHRGFPDRAGSSSAGDGAARSPRAHRRRGDHSGRRYGSLVTHPKQK